MTQAHRPPAAGPLRLGMGLTRLVLRLFGRWGGYMLMQPVAIFQLCWRPMERRAVLRYLRRLRGPVGFAGEWLGGVRVFYHYATAMVDRAYVGLGGGKKFLIVSVGAQRILEEVERGRGVLLLGSHAGNWEVAASVLPTSHKVKLSVVMVRAEGDELTRELTKNMPGDGPELLDQTGDSMLGLMVLDRLHAGGVVALKADRAMDDKSAIEVPFLGRPARFPRGPFVLAGTSGAAVMLLHCYREGLARYRLVVDPPRRFRFDRSRPKEEQLREWATWYAARLGEMSRRYPHQWFNVAPIWVENGPQHGADQ